MPNVQTQRDVVELRIPSGLGWERCAIDLAASIAQHMGFSADRIEDIKMAVAEATLNAIEHGNRFNMAAQVRVVLKPQSDRLEIVVHDHSQARMTHADFTVRPSLEARLAREVPARGWGMYLMWRLVDELEFASTSSGNSVRMVVHRNDH